MPDPAHRTSLPRRAVLGASALLAAPALLARRADAAESCVVGTWGGDYARLLRENIDDPILKPMGVEVVQDVGDETPRVAKLTARLSELAAARAAAPGAASGLERQIAHTSARLDKARQWLAGAKSALESAQQEVTETERELARDFPGPMAGPGAGAGRPA